MVTARKDGSTEYGNKDFVGFVEKDFRV